MLDNEINFVEIDAEKTYNQLLTDFEAAYGETLYPGDERRIFLQQLALVLTGVKTNINDSAKQNLLRYARGDILRAVGEDFHNTEIIDPQKSRCKGIIKLVATQNKDVFIEAGKRVTPDGTLYFIVKNSVTIAIGEIEKECELEALEAGEKYNGLIAGQIKNTVDPIPFVESIVNIDTSSGGSDVEDDERYRERCRLAPESYSTAGPDKAYEYFAKSADANISDVKIISPSPGVIRIVPLLKNGEIPSQEILDKIYDKTNDKSKRPLTDKVEVTVPTIINYNIDITYFLDKEYQTEELKFKKAIEGENLDYADGAVRDYISWQQEKLGRTINPDELRYRIQNAATYTGIDNKNYTAVRRIIVNSPSLTSIGDTEIAKVGIITLTYGGLE